MVETNSQLIDTKQPLEYTSNLETNNEKPWTSSYNALKLPVLKFLRSMGNRGATPREVADAKQLPRKNIESALRRYYKWKWVDRQHPPIRPGAKRKRGRPKYVYGITEKGLHELGLLEDLDAAGLPLKPREFKPSQEGKLGEMG